MSITKMDSLIQQHLENILNSDVDEDIIQYVKTMTSVSDFKEFIENVIDKNNPQHLHSYTELSNVLFTKSHVAKPQPTVSNKKQPQNSSFEEVFPNLPGAKGQNVQSQQKTSCKTPKQTSSTNITSKTSYKTPPNRNDLANKQQKEAQSSSSGGKSKKTKFVNIGSFDSSIGMKKGRHPCNCEAKEHQLINNCLKCGRIVCMQEGSGPCLFCDSMVCTNEQLSVLESNSKQSSTLYNLLKEQKTSEQWKKAIATRDRLIAADKSNDYKSTIYDDQSDYYSGDKWKSEGGYSERKVRKSKKDLKLALDFASRMVITTDDGYQKQKENLLKGVNKLLDSTECRFPKNRYDLNESGSNLDDSFNSGSDKQPDEVKPNRLGKIKVANDAFLSEIDRGMCLSMHQPWASLLVSGIKMHEGRSWYSNHRGRLWIHAASKEPESNDILEVEELYRTIYNDPELVFPRRYPTSCLLGCVFVEECLSQDRYRQFYQKGESDSPYVFICNNPIILPVFYPMQGQHKIFSLPRDVHNKAKEGIMSAKWI